MGTGMDDMVRADEVYAADLETRPGSAARQRLRVAGAFVAELVWGLLPHPSTSDLVVRQRDDGTEVLRTPAGDPNLVGDLVARVRTDLAALPPADFRAAWGVDGS